MLKPLHDRVVVKRIPAETVSVGGILIPDNAAEKPEQGEVIAIGGGKMTDTGKIAPMSVSVGDKVLFGKYSGQTVKVNGEEILVMREEDIMGILA
jgi:chaperonin GroES